MSLVAARLAKPAALLAGLGLMLAYAAWQWLEPHGPHEFAYAPMAVEPMPYAAMRGFTYEQLWGHIRRILLLGPGLSLFIWGLVGRVKVGPPVALPRWARWAGMLSVTLTAGLMLVLLKGRALFDDELAYAMQAGFFADGRLTGPDLGLNPNDYFNVWTPHGYSVKYPPGEPLVQVLGVLAGVPALMHLPLLALTLLLWYRTLELSSGERIAAFGTIALACSPMLIFTTATGLSHASALFCVVVMGYGLELARDGRAVAGGAAAGGALALGMLTRPQAVLPAAAVLGVALLIELWRRRAFGGVLSALATSGVGVATLLAYNAMVTGSPWRLPWLDQCDTVHFGFGQIWAMSTYQHTIWKGLENLAVVALRLNSWWLGLPVSLGVAIGYFMVRFRSGRSRDWVWLGVGLAVVAFELCYYSPGVSDTGAVYHYELLLPGSVMAATLVDALLERFPSWAPLALLTSLLLGTGSWVVEQGLRIERLVSVIHRDSDQALARVQAPALLIHERREPEVVMRGWLFSSFPRRFRRPADAVVTVPRITPDIWERARRVYPGRACWYFRHLPGSSTPELLKCEDAVDLMARPAIIMDASLRNVFWERPTAYFRSSFEPFQPIFQRRVRDAQGRVLAPCCQLRALEQIGAKVEGASAPPPCVETGDR